MIDRSLARLCVERLDLVQFHWWDYGVPGMVEAAGWLDDLRQAGKIRLLGATNMDTPRLRALLDAGVPIATNQVQYSVLDRRPAEGMTALCRQRGVSLLCYGTVAGGFLTDTWRGEADPVAPGNRSLVKYRLVIQECGGWDRLQIHVNGWGGNFVDPQDPTKSKMAEREAIEAMQKLWIDMAIDFGADTIFWDEPHLYIPG